MKTLQNEGYTLRKDDGHRLILLGTETLTATRTLDLSAASVGRTVEVVTMNDHDSYPLNVSLGSDKMAAGTTSFHMAMPGQAITLHKAASGLWLPLSSHGIEIGGLSGLQGVVRGGFRGPLSDATATTMFEIRTVNESGNTDGGGWVMTAHVLISHAASSGTGAGAVRAFDIMLTRAIEGDATDAISAVQTDLAGSTVATDAAVRTLGSITFSASVVSAYRIALQVNADATGSSPSSLAFVADVKVVWIGFLTCPTLTK